MAGQEARSDQDECPEGEHERMKADADLWARATEPPYGHATQPVLAYYADDRFVRVGNCRACKSTLYQPVAITLAVRR